MIELDRVTVKYPDGTVALSELSLRIAPGESIALIGANGAGKTTLFLTLVGMLTPVQGHIRVAGLEWNKKNAAVIRQRLGMVFQNPDDQLFTAGVYDEIAFGPRNYGLDNAEVERRVTAALHALHIEHLRERMPAKLSGGEKRMVALAAVLALEPQAILFDEPATFLDPRARRDMVTALSQLTVTKIIATHDLPLAAALCDRVLFLQEGRLIADDSAAVLLHDEARLMQGGL